MTQSKWARTHVRCPLWRGNEARRIGCEAPFDGATILLQQGEKNTRRHMEIFCCKRYENCEIFRMVIENKYPEE